MAQSPSADESVYRYALVLHGGAGGDPAKWNDEFRAAKKRGLKQALQAGVSILASGGTSLDAVEAVVRVLEDDPLFNAGRGCVLNEQGEHELDAAVMDGKTLGCGSVSGVRRVRHPVSLARRVMTDSQHVYLAGHGADEFARSIGLEEAFDDYFRTSAQLEAWGKWRAKQAELSPGAIAEPGAFDASVRYFGTVGCAAIDCHGNIAAATSTGGLMGKRWGRVGDTPVIGAGTYAHNAACGVSCTGTGEEFIRHNVSADLAARMRYAGQSLQAAASEVIQSVLPPDCGGLVAVDRNYNIVMEFNTACMARAAADSTGRFSVLLEHETDLPYTAATGDTAM